MIDIGAGSGLVAEALATSLDVKVTLVDVVDYNRSGLPLQLYDGRRLPFEARRFNVALLAFVLHHSADPGGTLQEAQRVARRVVVLEDTYRFPLEKASLIWTDWVLNRGQGSTWRWPGNSVDPRHGPNFLRVKA